jgi:hypothetical protein
VCGGQYPLGSDDGASADVIVSEPADVDEADGLRIGGNLGHATDDVCEGRRDTSECRRRETPRHASLRCDTADDMLRDDAYLALEFTPDSSVTYCALR